MVFRRIFYTIIFYSLLFFLRVGVFISDLNLRTRNMQRNDSNRNVRPKPQADDEVTRRVSKYRCFDFENLRVTQIQVTRSVLRAS